MADGDKALVEKLRQQRDRFIAFAFAGADLLLEMTDGDVISYSAGAGEALYGLSDSDLQGKKLADFIFPRDRKRFEEAIQRLHNSGRLDHTPLSVMGTAGTITRMRMSGIRLPQFKDCYHVVLSRIPPMVIAEDEAKVANDPKVAFVEMVRARLNEANRVGQEYTLTLFDLSGTNLAAADPAAAQSFLTTLHHTLEQVSVRGASAGQMGERHFGLVHEQSVTAEHVRARVAEVTGKFGDKVGNVPIQMRSATLEMEDSTLSDDDIGKALSYIVNNFVRSSADFAIRSLVDGARVAIDDTLTRVRNFRKMVKGNQLVFLFQPVVNLHTGAVLNYEAFGRINYNGNLFLPAQIVPFATEVGIIGEFDLVACKKALEMMKSATEVSTLAHVAVNVSGQSLGNPAFYHALLKVLEENKGLLARLIIEIADADRIFNLDEARRLLTRIRRLGARISLDDFGSGGTAFEILRTLPADYAKLDPAFIRDGRNAKGRAVLKALAGMCKDLGIVTVGECVEDPEMLQVLRDVGVDYAQGYYFSPPKADAAKKIKYFTEQVKAAGTAEPGLQAAAG